MSLEDRDGHIWLDGALIPWRDARVHVLSSTFQHGAGVFEGTRAYATKMGTSVFRLQDHIERLLASAKILQIPLQINRDHLYHAHLDVIRANNLSQCYLRTNVYYDGKVPGVSAQGNAVHVSIAAWEWNAYLGSEAALRGVRVKTSSFARPHINSCMHKAKANGHYLNSMLAVHEAKQQGFDDALMLDTQGCVAECSTSNIFLVQKNNISTPDRSSILEGITRDTIMILAKERGFQIAERRITRDEVYCADEVFITGTAAEITPVVELDNRKIGAGSRGPVTERLQVAYSGAVTGAAVPHTQWLTLLA
jgi:branched-chain amino acid aminotransferase